MPQILVRELSPETVERLKARAKDRGRSLQSEVKSILERAADERRLSPADALKACDEIRSRCTGRPQTDSVVLIREDRDR